MLRDGRNCSRKVRRGIFPKDLMRKQVQICSSYPCTVCRPDRGSSGMARPIKWGDNRSGSIGENGRVRVAGPGGKVAVSGSFGKRSRLSRPEEK